MCTIDGSVDFMVGIKNGWAKGLPDDLVEELEGQARQQIIAELSGAEIAWSMNRESLSELPADLASAETLPASAVTHFIDCALGELNDGKETGDHIWFAANEPDDAETCCYYKNHIWRPCTMVMLNRGAGKDRVKERWTLTLEHGDLEQPIEVQLMAKVEWTHQLEGGDSDTDTREKIRELLPQAQGAPLQQALEILAGASA